MLQVQALPVKSRFKYTRGRTVAEYEGYLRHFHCRFEPTLGADPSCC
jgi:hypothetical protein